MLFLVLNPIVWFPLSVIVYLLLRTYRPKMDKVEAAIVATGLVPLLILLVARRFGS
jgi:hypothetical protein